MDALLRERQVRAARNQSLFREVNERIELIGAAMREEIGYVCECLNLDCNAPIHLSGEEYETVRAGGSTRFLVKPGHAVWDVEKIVDEHLTYLVVEMVEIGSEVAAALDPRAREGFKTSVGR